MKDERMIEVMLRVEKDTKFLLAVMPYDLADGRGSCTVYDGQHGGADYNWVLLCTRPANESESIEIMKILKNGGYDVDNIKIIKRRNYDKYLKDY